MGYGRLDEKEVLARLRRQLMDIHLRELMYLADMLLFIRISSWHQMRLR
jgi:hypothetical protein